MPDLMETLLAEISSCSLCEARFRVTETAHSPRPVIWAGSKARILIAGQAPGMRVYRSGIPFSDPSGDRLRAWMSVDQTTFYDRSRIAIVPMGFCFPGYRKGADLPPPAICAGTWRARVLDALPDVKLTLLVGGSAQRWHLGTRSVTETVQAWHDYLPDCFPLPHPSWRNTGWMKRNPWFETDLLPELRQRVLEELDGNRA